MRILITLCLVLVHTNLFAETYYVDWIAGDCTKYDPATRNCGSGTFVSYAHVYDCTINMDSGDTCWIRSGNYTSEQDRIAIHYRDNVKILGDLERPVISAGDWSNRVSTVVVANSNNVIFYNLVINDIDNAVDYVFYGYKSKSITLKNIAVHSVGSTVSGAIGFIASNSTSFIDIEVDKSYANKGIYVSGGINHTFANCIIHSYSTNSNSLYVRNTRDVSMRNMVISGGNAIVLESILEPIIINDVNTFNIKIAILVTSPINVNITNMNVINYDYIDLGYSCFYGPTGCYFNFQKVTIPRHVKKYNRGFVSGGATYNVSGISWTKKKLATKGKLPSVVVFGVDDTSNIDYVNNIVVPVMGAENVTLGVHGISTISNERKDKIIKFLENGGEIAVHGDLHTCGMDDSGGITINYSGNATTSEVEIVDTDKDGHFRDEIRFYLNGELDSAINNKGVLSFDTYRNLDLLCDYINSLEDYSCIINHAGYGMGSRYLAPAERISIAGGHSFGTNTDDVYYGEVAYPKSLFKSYFGLTDSDFVWVTPCGGMHDALAEVLVNNGYKAGRGKGYSDFIMPYDHVDLFNIISIQIGKPYIGSNNATIDTLREKLVPYLNQVLVNGGIIYFFCHTKKEASAEQWNKVKQLVEEFGIPIMHFGRAVDYIKTFYPYTRDSRNFWPCPDMSENCIDYETVNLITSPGPIPPSASINISYDDAHRVQISLSLYSGDYSGKRVDYFLFVDTPYGRYYFAIPSGIWERWQGEATYTGQLVSFEDLLILDAEIPPGPYMLHFGVDFDPNGQIDWDSYYSDSEEFL